MIRREDNNRIAVIGSFALALWQVLATPVFAFVALVVSPLPPLVRYAIIAKWSAGVIFFARLFCGINYRVIGRENIPATPCIFFSRHESTWETLAFQHILPPQAIVLRRSLLSIPFFGWGLRQMSPIAIDRESGAAALKLMLRQGRERLREGFCIVIFPEGTRLPPGETRPYRKGGAWLAEKLSAPVVPVALDSGKCWRKNAFFKRRGLITVRIGEPIPPDEADINARVQSWMKTAL
ncbi:MAG: lysophospholipid acyltransferase family protein [Gammaproteobacteria bacterium]